VGSELQEDGQYIHTLTTTLDKIYMMEDRKGGTILENLKKVCKKKKRESSTRGRKGGEIATKAKTPWGDEQAQSAR